MMASIYEWVIGKGKRAEIDRTGGTPQLLIKHALFEHHLEVVAIQSKQEAELLIRALKQAKEYLP